MTSEQLLDPGGPGFEPFRCRIPLRLGADKSDEGCRRAEIGCHDDVVHREEADLLDGEVTTDDFRHLATEEFGHPLEAAAGRLRSLHVNRTGTPASGRGSHRVRIGKQRRSGELLGDLFDAVALDEITFLEVIESLEADAALESGPHLIHLVLEALERE